MFLQRLLQDFFYLTMFPTKRIAVDQFLLITELDLEIIKPVISMCSVSSVHQLVENKTNNYLDIELHI